VIRMGNQLKKWIAYRRVLREADVVIHVVDARDVKGTLNRWLNKYKSKLLVAVNKCDLVPQTAFGEIDTALSSYNYVLVSGKTGLGMSALYSAISSLARRTPAKVAIVGYPNVGKSTLMNRICGRHTVKVSPIPGETKGVQWVSARGFLFVDTPGVIPRYERREEDLVLKGAIRADNILNPEPIAEEVIGRFLEESPEKIKETYDIRVSRRDTPSKLLERIARRRGFLLKGGEPNLYEAAKLVIRDYQRGRLSIS